MERVCYGRERIGTSLFRKRLERVCSESEKIEEIVYLEEIGEGLSMSRKDLGGFI